MANEEDESIQVEANQFVNLWLENSFSKCQDGHLLAFFRHPGVIVNGESDDFANGLFEFRSLEFVVTTKNLQRMIVKRELNLGGK